MLKEYTVILLILVVSQPTHGKDKYQLVWEAKGSSFFDMFNFATYDDPTNGMLITTACVYHISLIGYNYMQGFVNYVNQSAAQGTLGHISYLFSYSFLTVPLASFHQPPASSLWRRTDR
jgi:hypothetical protein